MHLKFRTYNDYRTSRVIDTLTEQVLTETALLTFEAIGKRLQRTVNVALHCRALARVVEQRVDSFLKHTLFVAQNHFRSLDFDESFQTVVADNHTTIEVVKVAGGKTSAIEWHQRTQFGRDDRNNLQNHPFRAVNLARSAERFHHLQTLQSLGFALLRTFLACSVAQFVRQLVEVETAKQIVDGFGTHLGNELVRVVVGQQVVVLWQTVENVEIFVLAQEVEFIIHFRFVVGKKAFGGCWTRIENDIAFVIDNRIELLRRQAQQIADFVRQRTEIPDVSNRHNELDVARTFATNLLFGNFHTATVAHDALVTDSLILSAMAFVVLYRAENAFAEQTVALRLIGTVVDSFWLEYFSIRIFKNRIGRSQTNRNL